MKVTLYYDFYGNEEEVEDYFFEYEINVNVPLNDEGEIEKKTLKELKKRFYDEAYETFLEQKMFERDPYAFYGISR